MAQIRLTGNGRTYAGRRDLTDSDHDALLIIFEQTLDIAPHGTSLLNVAALAIERVTQLARAQGWTDAAAESLAITAGLIYAEVISGAHREERINAHHG